MEDEFSRSGLALEMSSSFPSRSVVSVLDSVAAIYGYPKYLRVDHGTELTSKLMQLWSEEHDVELLFNPASQRRTPTSSRSMAEFARSCSTRIGSIRPGDASQCGPRASQ